jgi:hypothetical protein
MTPTATPVTYGHDASLAKFSVTRYQRMIETGILRPLLRSLPADWDIRIQSAITLADSQPEPDFALVRGSADDYDTRHPGPADVGLIIEVADSSLLRDQRDKTRIYARGGIPCYWIVNLVDQRIEVYTQPSGPAAVPAYHAFQVYQPGDDIPLVLGGSTTGIVLASDLLP